MKHPARKIVLGISGFIPVLLAACTNAGAGGVDVKPIESGLEFLGMAGVLVALIVVLGRFIGR